eukprot:GGOE01022643.1.p1 GENE.GGOE01022643.1~~GGOE01022643.1.p1  ORF type:complete len:606 (-),score=115.01 GGOE01022643.1:158-1975(-)
MEAAGGAIADHGSRELPSEWLDARPALLCLPEISAWQRVAGTVPHRLHGRHARASGSGCPAPYPQWGSAAGGGCGADGLHDVGGSRHTPTVVLQRSGRAGDDGSVAGGAGAHHVFEDLPVLQAEGSCASGLPCPSLQVWWLCHTGRVLPRGLLCPPPDLHLPRFPPLHSFESPFLCLDDYGDPEVEGWKVGGAAKLHRDFLRLTPERFNKIGHIWSRNALQQSEVTVAAKVRISGHDATYFGEALGVWVTTERAFQRGSLYGFRTKFVGVAAVLVASRNGDESVPHLGLFVNDGTEDKLLVEDAGCTVAVRTTEKRRDWSVANATLLRLQITPVDVVLWFALPSHHQWQSCASTTLGRGGRAMPDGWLQQCHIGVTGVTASVAADNHDILMLKAHTLPTEVDAYLPEPAALAPNQVARLTAELHHQFIGFWDQLNQDLSDLQQREQEVEEHLALLEEKLSESLQQDLERRVAVLEELRLERFEGREADLFQRIAEAEQSTSRDLKDRLDALEGHVEQRIVDKLSQRVQVLEKRMAELVEHRVTTLEMGMTLFITERASAASQKLGRSWFIPFFVMGALLFTVFGWIWFDLHWLGRRLMARMIRTV